MMVTFLFENHSWKRVFFSWKRQF